MRTPTQRRADRIIAAIADSDDLTLNDTLNGLNTNDLTELVLELAHRTGPVDTDAGVLTQAVAIAAKTFNTTPESILSGSRRREDVEARQVVCYATTRLLGASYSVVGRQIGKDHSTVISACTRVGENPRLRGIATRIATSLGWDRNAFDVTQEGA